MSYTVIHIGDIHYCEKNFDEVDRCMRYTIDTLHFGSDLPDVIVIPGDTFDHRLDQNSRAFLTAIDRVRELADIAPLLILQGTFSHDAPNAINVFRSVQSQWPIYVADRIDQVLYDGCGFVDEFSLNALPREGILFSCLPAINKGTVAATAGADDVSVTIGENVAALLRSWAPSHLAARAGGLPAVILSHGTVAESSTEHGVPMAGLDWEYSTGALFASEATVVMLNHIHAHQSWERAGRWIGYAGSIGRYHYGEYHPKGFVDWCLEANTASLQLIQTPARELLDIDFENHPPNMGQLEAAARDAGDNVFVRIRYSIDHEYRNSVDKAAIARLFEHCAEVKIEPRILPIQRQRAAGISKAVTLDDMVMRWCELTHTDPEPVVDRLHQLHEAGTESAAQEKAA